jgi:hypothetical protein
MTASLPPLTSQYRPRSVFEEITIALATIKLNTKDGSASVELPDLSSSNLKTYKCAIAKEEFNHGSNQIMYKVTCD